MTIPGYMKVVVTMFTADGAVTNAAGRTVGHLRACFGATSDSLVTWFHAQGGVVGIQFTGHGDCRTTGRQVPEPGITPRGCYLDLTALPDSLGGGQPTTNSVNSRAVSGLASDPPVTPKRRSRPFDSGESACPSHRLLQLARRSAGDCERWLGTWSVGVQVIGPRRTIACA